MELNKDLLNCALVLGILFFVFSHPLLYRLLHKYLRSVVSLVDERLCPTEAGVALHAVIFAVVVYFGKVLYDKKYKKKGKKNKRNNNLNQNNNNVFKQKMIFLESVEFIVKR